MSTVSMPESAERWPLILVTNDDGIDSGGLARGRTDAACGQVTGRLLDTD